MINQRRLASGPEPQQNSCSTSGVETFLYGAGVMDASSGYASDRAMYDRHMDVHMSILADNMEGGFL
jgi:hypothetical protein